MRSLPLWECGLKSFCLDYKKKVRRSLPLWECGLKLLYAHKDKLVCKVTPLVGVWIEIGTNVVINNGKVSHSPCGSVD